MHDRLDATAGTIVVRRPDFQWPETLPLLPVPDDPEVSCELLAISFTLPYLEPYLIRTMRAASKEVEDPQLKAEIKAFSGQEAQHHQNHTQVNDLVRAQLSAPTATAIRDLEDRLEADYRRSTATRSLAFNLAYAEGFEAMTFALARSLLESDVYAEPTWRDLIAWHLSEEIEHRTVTFDAYEHVVGKYPYRLAVGTWSQMHYLRYVLNMATVFERELANPGATRRHTARCSARRQWRMGTIPGTLRAMSPRYNPRRVELSDTVRMVAAAQGINLA